MKFIIDVPDNMVSKDIIDPKEIIRLMRSHVAHLGTITVEPLIEDGIEQRLKRTPTRHECGSPPCK